MNSKSAFLVLAVFAFVFISVLPAKISSNVRGDVRVGVLERATSAQGNMFKQLAAVSASSAAVEASEEPSSPTPTPTPFGVPPRAPAGEPDEYEPRNGCGRTLTPPGNINETIRCDGRNWVAADNLLNNGINIGIGALAPIANYKVWMESNYIKSTLNSKNTGTGAGIIGIGNSGEGVIGESQSIGIKGMSYDGNSGIGVYGRSRGPTGFGVVGENESPTGGSVLGKTTNGTGIFGHVSGNGTGIAVRASYESNNTGGYGIYQDGANAKNFFQGKVAIGENAPGTAQLTTDVVNIDAIKGLSMGGRGVVGESFDHPGVYGFSNRSTGVEGVSVATQGMGVFGSSSAASGVGVKGLGGHMGVYGHSINALGGTGVSGLANGAGGRGVYGSSAGENGTGVFGQSDSSTGVGVMGLTTVAGGKGVRGIAQGVGSIGVEGNVSGSSLNATPLIAVKAVTGDNEENAYGFVHTGSGLNYFQGGVVIGVPSAPAGQALTVKGGFHLYTSEVRPACTSTIRGTFWNTQGAAGVADMAQLCAKNADGTFAWKNLF